MLKFAFITPWYGMFAGGLEAEFRCYAEILAQAGYSVEVLTTCSQSPYHSWQEDYFSPGKELHHGVTVHRFRTNKHHREKYLNAEKMAKKNPSPELQYDFFHFGIGSDELVQFIGQYSDDTILICGPYFQSLSYLAITAYPNRIYLRAALHDEAQVSWQPVADMLQAAKGYLLATEAEKDLAIYYHAKKLGKKIIEAPIIGVPVTIAKSIKDHTVIDHSQKQKMQSSQKKALPYTLPDKFILYIGRKEIGKGIDKLVSWYQYYLEECKKEHQTPLSLVLLGGGHNHLIPKHPCFIDLNFVPEQDKHILLSMAHCLINLSPNESFSLVLMEAWSQSTPVIVFSGCAATSEHCYKSGGGYTVDSSISFNHALQNMNDNSVRATMGQAGRQYLLKHYPLSKVMDNFLNLVGCP